MLLIHLHCPQNYRKNASLKKMNVFLKYLSYKKEITPCAKEDTNLNIKQISTYSPTHKKHLHTNTFPLPLRLSKLFKTIKYKISSKHSVHNQYKT